MGIYFEEIFVGQKHVTDTRTISEEDILQFAELTGDNNRIHVDPEYSKTTQFGKQIAHGALGLSLALGLVWKTGFMDGTVIAFREIREWKFVKPVFIGDTIHVELETTETKPLPRIGGGSVTVKSEVFNQDNEVCHRGVWVLLMMSKPA